MMKKIKAFTLVELLIVIAIVSMLSVLIGLPIMVNRQNRQNAPHVTVGDTMYIDSLNITGIVNAVQYYEGHRKVSLLIKGTNGIPITLNDLDARLLKKVSPSPKDEWTH